MAARNSTPVLAEVPLWSDYVRALGGRGRCTVGVVRVPGGYDFAFRGDVVDPRPADRPPILNFYAALSQAGAFLRSLLDYDPTTRRPR